MNIVTSNQVESCVFETVDGHKYSCIDLLVDDQEWGINFLVLRKKSKWNPFKKPLIVNPALVSSVEAEARRARLRIDNADLKDLATKNENVRPISKRRKERIFAAFGYGQYWMAPGITGTYPRPAASLKEPKVVEQELQEQPEEDDRAANLRSIEEMVGYHVEQGDRKLGRAETFLCDTRRWEVSHCLSSEGFIRHHHWAVPVERIHDVDWARHKIH